jgi:AraC family transcriptional regulator, regulatory protein of adaptative response / methylated-DNA-[protein]-cysteine methyltransferase
MTLEKFQQQLQFQEQPQEPLHIQEQEQPCTDYGDNIVEQSFDYQRISSAIEFIHQHLRQQPTLDEVAAHLHLSPAHCQRLFKRWAGVSPKRFLQCLTLQHAKSLLANSASVLETSLELGLGSPSRVYDHFVQLEAITPGEFKRMGEGMEIRYGYGDTPYGEAFLAWTARGICQLVFVMDNPHDEVSQLQCQWPAAMLREENDNARARLDHLFGNNSQPGTASVPLLVKGSAFQLAVWRALLNIPVGHVASYQQIAKTIGKPSAVRAVGTAIGANPVAWLIPCHRVIRSSGGPGGYRWGLERKLAMCIRETGPLTTMMAKPPQNDEPGSSRNARSSALD